MNIHSRQEYHDDGEKKIGFGGKIGECVPDLRKLYSDFRFRISWPSAICVFSLICGMIMIVRRNAPAYNMARIWNTRYGSTFTDSIRRSSSWLRGIILFNQFQELIFEPVFPDFNPGKYDTFCHHFLAQVGRIVIRIQNYLNPPLPG